MTSGAFTESPGADYLITIPDFTSGATFENLGTTVEIVGESGSVTIPGSNKTFEFKQFHFHLPSEHLDNGTSMAMEVHFVFQAADTEIAVLGVYIDVGAGSSSTTQKRQTGKTNPPLSSLSPSPPLPAKISLLSYLMEAANRTCHGKSKPNIDVSNTAADAASQMLETVFASVGEISNPGTATTTAAFAMSDLISMLSATTFKR